MAEAQHRNVRDIPADTERALAMRAAAPSARQRNQAVLRGSEAMRARMRQCWSRTDRVARAGAGPDSP